MDRGLVCQWHDMLRSISWGTPPLLPIKCSVALDSFLLCLTRASTASRAPTPAALPHRPRPPRRGSRLLTRQMGRWVDGSHIKCGRNLVTAPSNSVATTRTPQAIFRRYLREYVPRYLPTYRPTYPSSGLRGDRDRNPKFCGWGSRYQNPTRLLLTWGGDGRTSTM